jgi:hypothetical protein
VGAVPRPRRVAVNRMAPVNSPQDACPRFFAARAREVFANYAVQAEAYVVEVGSGGLGQDVGGEEVRECSASRRSQNTQACAQLTRPAAFNRCINSRSWR